MKKKYEKDISWERGTEIVNGFEEKFFFLVLLVEKRTKEELKHFLIEFIPFIDYLNCPGKDGERKFPPIILLFFLSSLRFDYHHPGRTGLYSALGTFGTILNELFENKSINHYRPNDVQFGHNGQFNLSAAAHHLPPTFVLPCSNTSAQTASFFILLTNCPLKLTISTIQTIIRSFFIH